MSDKINTPVPFKMPSEGEQLLAQGKAFYQAFTLKDKNGAETALKIAQRLVKLLRLMNITFDQVHTYFEKRMSTKLTPQNDKFLLQIEKMFIAEEKGHKGGYRDML